MGGGGEESAGIMGNIRGVGPRARSRSLAKVIRKGHRIVESAVRLLLLNKCNKFEDDVIARFFCIVLQSMGMNNTDFLRKKNNPIEVYNDKNPGKHMKYTRTAKYRQT